MVDVIEKNECTGCKLCFDVCPNKAINFETDDMGFWYPKIDKDKCDECGLCKRMCPSLSGTDKLDRTEPIVYAAWSKNPDTRYQSTSGGVFWEIASEFIKSGGVVVGSKWGDDCKSAYHSIAYDLDELVALRGSKYIQSDTEGIYAKIKSEIDKGTKVLFCGTPCQNAAIYKYLGTNEENIYYMDFICRSINSPLAFEKYVNEKETMYESKAINVRLKDKTKGWQSLASKIGFENGEVSLLDRTNDFWINGFLNDDLYTRDSCFSCQYRTIPRRIANITVGDFWGIEDESDYDMFCGISVILINDNRGEGLLKLAKKNLCIKEKCLADVVGGNPALYNNPINKGKRESFFDELQKDTFSQCVNKFSDAKLEIEDKSRQESYDEDSKKYAKGGIIDKELYYYLNFECENVIHKGKGKIIPYQNVVVDLDDSAQIFITGDKDFEIGTNLFRGSKAETLIRLERDSLWIMRHGGSISYGTTLEVKENATLDTGFFSINTGSVVVISKKMVFGEDVMIGRNVIIYDSDFHQIQDSKGYHYNTPKEVIIEDHVWLTANINVHKGVRIGYGSIVANQTVVKDNIPPNSLVAGQSIGRVIKSDVKWDRRSPLKYKYEFETRKVILYGYGIEGKKFYKRYKDNISYVIDNKEKNDLVVTFNEFIKKNKLLCNDQYIWVIASQNFFDDIYKDIHDAYPTALVVSYTDI